MTALIAAFQPVLTELAVLAALAAPPVYGLARRPAPADRLLAVPPKPWLRILFWVVVGLIAWGAAGRAWLGLTHDGFSTHSGLAAASVKMGAAVVLWLHYTSATLVAGRNGLHWFSFFRPWRELSSVERTDTGVRFAVEGRPGSAHASVLDDSLWAVNGARWRTLRSLVESPGQPASDPSSSHSHARGHRSKRRGRDVVRRPLPTASHRIRQ